MMDPRLSQLLDTVRGKNPFYTQKLEGIDIREITDIPYTTHAEWVADQMNNPPFGTNLTYPMSHYTRVSQTSGSSGTPMCWLDTPESWQWMLGNWKQVFNASGVNATDRIYFSFSFGPFLGFWTAFEAAVQQGCMAIPGGGLRTTARLRAICAMEASVLCCTPTYALHLGQVAREEGIDTLPIRKVVVAGEPGGSIGATRQAIEELLGATVYDHHGMTEVGPVSMPHPEGLQILEDRYIAEMVDERDDGTGELVLTTLGRVGSPLIRYRTGDLVRLREDGLLVGGILGRVDDMVVVRGVNLYPAAVDAVVRRVPGILEYRVLLSQQKSMNEIRIEIEAAAGDGTTEAEQLCRACRESFSLRVAVQPVPPETLPRFELKAKRWVRGPG